MTHRRAMTKARKARIWARDGGVCYHCGLPVPMLGPDVRYDHRVGVWLTERDEDDDVSPAHTTCDRDKTRADLSRIAKVKRIQKKSNPETRKPPTMRSRGFGGQKQKIPSRPFQRKPK